MQSKLARLGVKINILNPGAVDTDIRRKAEFPRIIKMLFPLIGFLIAGSIRSPKAYAQIPLGILKDENAAANQYILINSRGKGIAGSPRVNDPQTQQALYEKTKQEIDRVLTDVVITDWL